MPTGVTLGTIITQYRHEAGESATLAQGANTREMVVYRLARTQRELFQSHDWPKLKVWRDVTLAVGTRYYTFPSDLDFDSINKVWVQHSSVWSPILFGISPEDYSLYNSEQNFRSFPPLKWNYAADTGLMEVWPVPDQAGTLRIEGRKALGAFAADSDVCTLDSDLIVLFAAAEALAERKSERAQVTLSKAQNLLKNILRRQRSNKTEPFVLGGGGYGVRSAGVRVGIDYIPEGFGKGG